jgi:hypothetical protein
MNSATLFVPVGRDITLLEQNLDYYTQMGIKKILISVHLRPEWEEGFLDSINEVIEKYPATIADLHTAQEIASKARYDSVIKKHCSPGDWVIIADQDEFYEYSQPLAETIKCCEENGYDYVTGEFLDRVGPIGDMPEIKDMLWDSFPIGVKLTKEVVKGGAKVTLARASVNLTAGHHRALNGRACPNNICSTIVHHFKWDSTCIDRTRYMADVYQRGRFSCVSESLRVLDYLDKNKGKIKIDDPALEAYWPIFNRTSSSTESGLESIYHDPNNVTPVKQSHLKIKKSSESNYLVTVNNDHVLAFNQSTMVTFDLCDGQRNVAEIVSILRDVYPASWQMMEYQTQSALRSLNNCNCIKTMK